MNSKEKSFFTRLKNENEFFKIVIEKMTKLKMLNTEENSYILSLSILFYKAYLESNYSAYFEFSYYLVLFYSMQTKDYGPLLDFSFNNGFFPIARSILINQEKNILTPLLNLEIKKYSKEDIVELKEQKEKIERLTDSKQFYRAFIAPTSYGKSSFILEDIKKQKANIIGIIVPKKALIWQSFRNIKGLAKELSYKVLLHDSEYKGEKRFIGIFTQERATRLIQDSDIFFDVLYIDEAHNIFEKDERSILLARLIKLNKKLNINQKVIYLSPLIKDINNLKISNQDMIDTQKISFNIKEYNIRYYDKNCQNYVYNRFVDDFYQMDESYDNWFKFILMTSKNKNLIFLNRPRDIERFSKSFSLNFSSLNEKELNEIADIIEKYVDKDYTMVSLIKRGILYIHSKIPDIIKDYLLEKFKKCVHIKYLISNSTVFEGVNFPIDNLYIFNTWSLNANNLKNLCGRVNRLNEIFTQPPQLDKLICPINFVETKEFGGSNNFKNKIKLLRCDEEDDVKNPLLENSRLEENQRKEIKDREESFIENPKSKSLKSILIKNNINQFYKNFDATIDKIESEIAKANRANSIDSLFDLIFSIFLSQFEIEEISDFEFLRLQNETTRKFYKNYLNSVYYSNVKAKVRYFLKYFEYFEKENMSFYIGNSFGEIPYRSNNYIGKNNTYIDPRGKSYSEKVNLAVIKSKIEDDFVDFKIQKLVKTLLDLELISNELLNKFLYNTTDEKETQLMSMGLSRQLFTFIEDNSLLNDVYISITGIEVSKRFKEVLMEQDDLIQFEIEKFI